MYTGITQGLFPVTFVSKQAGLVSYRVRLSPELLQGLAIGASVSVDGVCQTVVAIEQNEVSFDAIAETCRKTTLAELKIAQMVSIERSAVVGAEIGGHAMYGHVYGTGSIVAREASANNLQLCIACPAAMMSYIFEKGFIGVNGSSLTVNGVDLDNHTFRINLIPHTLAVTDFSNKQIGDPVNLELDANVITIVETIKRMKLHN